MCIRDRICTTVAAPLLSVVTGTVQDASTGEAVIGAAVILQNTTYGACLLYTSHFFSEAGVALI